MTDNFLTVRFEANGALESVEVFVRGRSAGTLYTGPGDGSRVATALLSAKYFGTDRPTDSPITPWELTEWRVLAAGWLDVEEIITVGETGFVGRTVLRLLDALHAAESRGATEKTALSVMALQLGRAESEASTDPIPAPSAEHNPDKDDVVRALFILPRREDWPACWPVVRRHFGTARPAATMIQAGLQDEAMRIEIEVTARLKKDTR